jgi:hypothetical protein
MDRSGIDSNRWKGAENRGIVELRTVGETDKSHRPGTNRRNAEGRRPLHSRMTAWLHLPTPERRRLDDIIFVFWKLISVKSSYLETSVKLRWSLRDDFAKLKSDCREEGERAGKLLLEYSRLLGKLELLKREIKKATTTLLQDGVAKDSEVSKWERARALTTI